MSLALIYYPSHCATTIISLWWFRWFVTDREGDHALVIISFILLLQDSRDKSITSTKRTITLAFNL